MIPSSSVTSKTEPMISSTESRHLQRSLKLASMHDAVSFPKGYLFETVGWCSANASCETFQFGVRGAPRGHLASSQVSLYHGAGKNGSWLALVPMYAKKGVPVFLYSSPALRILFPACGEHSERSDGRVSV